MKESDRGMVKYAPYQSLVEQAKYLAKMRQDRLRVPKRSLFADAASEINEILTHYEGEEVMLEYYEDGRIIPYVGVIYSIDGDARALWIQDRAIPFSAIQSLQKRSPDTGLLYVPLDD